MAKLSKDLSLKKPKCFNLVFIRAPQKQLKLIWPNLFSIWSISFLVRNILWYLECLDCLWYIKCSFSCFQRAINHYFLFFFFVELVDKEWNESCNLSAWLLQWQPGGDSKKAFKQGLTDGKLKSKQDWKLRIVNTILNTINNAFSRLSHQEGEGTEVVLSCQQGCKTGDGSSSHASGYFLRRSLRSHFCGIKRGDLQTFSGVRKVLFCRNIVS